MLREDVFRDAGGLRFVGFSRAPGDALARAIGFGIALIVAIVTYPAASLAVGPVATPPYTLTALTTLVPPSDATQPDDLAVSADGANLWVGYGNGVDTTGKGGPSNLVEYKLSSGAVLQNLSIPGHLDGLKINPQTNDIWTTENEDGNPTLAIVNHKNGKFKTYKFAPTLITGGMDDLVFSGPFFKDVFIVASSQTSTSTPAIVQISRKPKKINTALTSTLPGAPAMVWKSSRTLQRQPIRLVIPIR